MISQDNGGEYLAVGIDPSLTATGVWVIGHDRRGGCVYSARSPAKKKTMGDRISRAEELADEIINSINMSGEPSIVVLEGYSYASAGSVIQLAEFGGILRRGLTASFNPVVEVPPQRLKKWATGRGNAAKDDLILPIFKRYGLEFSTSHEREAFCLAQLGLQVLGIDTPDTKHMEAVVSGVRDQFELEKIEREEWYHD